MRVGGYQLWPVQTGGVILKNGGRLTPGQSGLLWTQTGNALSTIVNTTGSVAFTTPFVPPIIQANTLSVKGALFSVRAWGVYATNAFPTIIFSCRFDDATSIGTPAIGNATFTTGNNVIAGSGWMADYGLVVRTPGASGIYGMTAGTTVLGSAGVAFGEVQAAITASGVSIDTTVSHTVELAIAWGAADPGNTITLQGIAVSVAYPIVAA